MKKILLTFILLVVCKISNAQNNTSPLPPPTVTTGSFMPVMSGPPYDASPNGATNPGYTSSIPQPINLPEDIAPSINYTDPMNPPSNSYSNTPASESPAPIATPTTNTKPK